MNGRNRLGEGAGPEALIDRAFLAETLREVGAELLAPLAATFEEECAEALDALRRAAAAGDAAAAAPPAHLLKGAAAGLGLTALSEAAADVEAEARAGRAPGPCGAQALGDLAERSVAALRRFDEVATGEGP
jgi:HPt (histidine-containing phosphotransfer) domain-containing protein